MRRDIDLEAATLRLRASCAKNRKEAYQPLPPGTVAALEAAGIPYETADGKADLHALRVSFGTNLARQGVSLVQAQKLLRHSDPKLTANIYTRLRLDDAHEAVARTDIDGGARRAAR